MASLDLLESLLTDDQMSNLIVLGCYRSNEVDEAHLVSKMVRELQANSDRSEDFHITEMAIGNLELSNVQEMLTELLSSKGASKILGLAQVCHR